jgi:hypothetical protein
LVETGDGGEAVEEWLLVPVELVDGLSPVRLPSGRCCRNALKTVVFGYGRLEACPNVVELSLTKFESVEASGLDENTCGLSDEKLSNGNVSTAYCGGPIGTPNWR